LSSIAVTNIRRSRSSGRPWIAREQPRRAPRLHRRQHQQPLPDALAEPDVSFIVTPIDAEAHFVRDHGGVVRDAGEVERRRARMRRGLGVDVV
jgi:hypothetical protein